MAVKIENADAVGECFNEHEAKKKGIARLSYKKNEENEPYGNEIDHDHDNGDDSLAP